MRGVSLDEIADRTKIGTRLLKALEDEQFDLLPGGIFNKGFVRAYANYLGMDEEQAVAEYLKAAEHAEPDVQLIAQQGDRAENRYVVSARAERRGFPFLPVLLLLVVVAGGFGGWQLYQQHVARQEALQTDRQPPAVPPSAPASSDNRAHEVPQSSKAESPPAVTPPQPSTPAAETAAPTTTDHNSTASPSGFDVIVRTKGRAWVSLKADGKILVRGILDADQVRTLHANEEIVVWTGNAGMTEVTFQGTGVPIEGGPNEAWVLVFTPEGLKSSRAPVSTTPAPTPAQPVEQQHLPSPQQLPTPQ